MSTEPDDQGLRASGLFLLTIGIVLMGAFLYPFVPHRRAGMLWEHTSQSPRGLAFLLTGAGVGLLMVIAGNVLLNWRRWTRPKPGRHGALEEDNP